MFTLDGCEDKMASLQFVWFCHQMSSGIKLVKNQKTPKIHALIFRDLEIWNCRWGIME